MQKMKKGMPVMKPVMPKAKPAKSFHPGGMQFTPAKRPKSVATDRGVFGIK